MREPPFNSKLRCSQYQPRWLNIHGIEEWLLNIRSHRCMQKRWWLRRVARAWPVRISWQCRNSYGCFCIPKVATNIQPSTARCRGFSATLVDVVSTSALKQRVAYASRTLYFQGLKLSQVLCYVECKTKKKRKNKHNYKFDKKNFNYMVFKNSTEMEWGYNSRKPKLRHVFDWQKPLLVILVYKM